MGKTAEFGVAEATFSVYQDYAHGLGFNVADFTRYHLQNKLVLDVACGLGGLAKSIFLENPSLHLPVRGIVSVDLHADKQGLLQRSKACSEKYASCVLKQQGLGTRIFRKNRFEGTDVERAFRRTLCASTASALPFGDNIFDRVFDVDGASCHTTSDHGVDNFVRPEDKVRFRGILSELLRVIKPTGIVLIGDSDGYGTRWGYSQEGVPYSWKERIIQEMGLNYRLLAAKVDTDALPPWIRGNWYTTEGTLGVEIMK